MRKAMWKKGLSVAMAAAMLTGTVTVPAVFNTSAIVKAAEVAEKSMPATPKAIDGMVYATVNMEYADFFYGELNNIAAGNETTPDLSNDKVASYRETGMYDAVTSATNKKSIKYATSYYETGVANDEAETKGSNGTISNTTLYGIKEVKIAIPEALYHNLYEQKDDSANKNSKIYEYLNNADYSDEEFKSEYKVLNADGTFREVEIEGRKYAGKELYDVLEHLARQGYYEEKDMKSRKYGQDIMWFIWSNENSPVYGKAKMATFERYFLDDADLKKEKKDYYYQWYENEAVINQILEEFGLDTSTGKIVNGHMPVAVKKGESPIKCGGKLFVIDGGFSKAYQKTTGIAGYTLVSNSYGLKLVAHEPFVSRTIAIREETDIHSDTIVINKVTKRKCVMDTDNGKALQEKVADLEQLLWAYQKGLITERI